MHESVESGFSVPFSLFGIDLSINESIVTMWGVAAVIFLFLLVANRFKKVRMIESLLFDFVSDAFGSSIATKRLLWPAFLMTLFLFVFFNNLSGLIPGVESPTSNINVTGGLAVMVFLIAQGACIRHHGFHHFVNIVPKGVPMLMLPIMIPLEIISQLAKPFSLAVRLFANMYAGHKVLTIFMSLAVMAIPLLKLLPVAGGVLISMFEIFVAFIQAFIFTYLTSFYISETVNAAH